MRVAIVGASGAVGQDILALLAERNFPVTALTLFSSPRSAGKTVTFRGEQHAFVALQNGPIDADIVFSAASSSVAREHAFTWAKHGALVVDNSSAWRMDERVPLVVPEINAAVAHDHQGVIANPNCSTIIALMALAPLHRAFTLTRATIATYQAVSGAGAAGMSELTRQTKQHLAGEELTQEVFQNPIAFNLFSHDSLIGADGYNEEETKLTQESRKILAAPELQISATCIRVPVYRAHSEAIHAEFATPVTAEMATEVLLQAPGVQIIDDRGANQFPTPQLAAMQDDCFVGRLRNDQSRPGGIAFFISGDQVRKGAALNTVQIAELFT